MADGTPVSNATTKIALPKTAVVAAFRFQDMTPPEQSISRRSGRTRTASWDHHQPQIGPRIKAPSDLALSLWLRVAFSPYLCGFAIPHRRKLSPPAGIAPLQDGNSAGGCTFCCYGGACCPGC